MNGVPITTYVMPFVVLIIVVVMMINARRMRANFKADNPQYAFGALAQRWGLQLVQGDPAYNLYVNDHDTRVGFAVPSIPGMTGNTAPVEAKAIGQHRGHPVEFSFYDQTRIEKGVMETTYLRTFHCVLKVGVNAAVPPFELKLRNENEYLQTERYLDAPEQRFGHPALDPVLLLRSPEARVGGVLAPVVGALMAMSYVHVVSEPQAVKFTMTVLGTPTALYYAETLLQVLLAMADVFEGKQPMIPATPAAPPPR